MTKTRLEVVAQAHREIGVLSSDEVPTADQIGYAGDVLDSLFEELKEVHGMPFTWALDATPDAAFIPLSLCLAADIQRHYEMNKVRRSRAIGRLRAYAFPDDRGDLADYDQDGTVSDDERAAFDRGAFY
jgi:hypothetical protein